MKIALMAVVLVLGTMQMGQSSQQAPDEAAIRNIVQDEVSAWNRGNAEAYSRHFAEDGTFTNILGMFFTGREAFRARHEQLFRTVFRETTKQAEIVSLKFVRPDVAIVEMLQTVSGFQRLQKLFRGVSADDDGQLRLRLLQVMVRDGGECKVVTAHNVDVKEQK